MTDQQGRKKQPLHKIQRGSIEATIWENQTGEKAWHSIAIYRRYKTDDGAYREANTYALADLVQVARVAELAEEWLNRRAETQSSSAANQRGEQ